MKTRRTMNKNEIITKIGQAIMRAANNSSNHWKYAGYVFSYADGSVGMLDFLFDASQKRGFLEDRPWFKETRELFKQFREITYFEGDEHWIKCKAVLCKSDGKLKMLFELKDYSRWSISLVNIAKAFEIFVGDIFSESHEE